MMKTTRRDGQTLRNVVAWMVTDDQMLKAVSDHWTKAEALFDSPAANQVGGWCVEHWRRYGKAPGPAIRTLYEQWASTTKAPEETIRGVEKFLEAADREHEPVDSHFAIDVAERYFQSVRLKRLKEQTDDLAETGRIEEAGALLAGYEPFHLNGKADRLFPIMTMDEIFNSKMTREPYLIEGILVMGQPCVMAGPEKTLKTSLMLDLAVSLASDSPFLDRYEVIRPSNVLVMSGESGVYTLCKNLRTISAERCGGLPQERWPKKIGLSNKVPLFADRKHLTVLAEEMERTEAEVLCIDTAAKAMPGDTMANPVVNYELCAAVGELCADVGATFILLHHTAQRLQPGTVPQLSDIMYSGFKEYFRQWLMVNRRRPYTPPEQGRRVHELWINAGGSAGHSTVFGLTVDEGMPGGPRWREPDGRKCYAPGLSRDGSAWEVAWMPHGDAVADTRRADADANLPDDKRKVLEALKDGGRTQRQLQDGTKLTGRYRDRCKAAIRALIEEKMIREDKVPTGNGNRDGYVLS